METLSGHDATHPSGPAPDSAAKTPEGEYTGLVRFTFPDGRWVDLRADYVPGRYEDDFKLHLRFYYKDPNADPRSFESLFGRCICELGDLPDQSPKPVQSC